MIGRLIAGALVGLILGAGVAAAVVKGLGIIVFPALLAYLLAAGVGLLTGLFAGKPVWAAGGQIEAGLKAFFGALLATGAMFALRMWVHQGINLGAFGAGEIGTLPAASLPLIAATLGALFGLDNTPSTGDATAKQSGVRVAQGNGSASAALDEDDEEAADASRRARH